MTADALYDPDARRDTPLARKLADAIRQAGPISVADYMRACLYDLDHGYYRNRAAIGRAGDFITAPEISQIFGELIGLWCVVVWQQMGCPERVRLIELGPGRGTLMADALRAARHVPGFAAAADVLLVEVDPPLRKAQQNALADFAGRIAWTEDLSGWLREGDDPARVPAIVLGNEFLDTLPAAQFMRDGDRWSERCVDVNTSGRLVFATRPVDTATTGQLSRRYPQARTGQMVTLPDYAPVAPFFGPLPDGHPGWSVAAALFIDYGEPDGSAGDTLQAVRGHAYEHVLTSPGEADLSALVDFGDSMHRATGQGFAVDGPTTQAEFLGRLGAIERASRLMAANPAAAGSIEAGLARLLAPQGMGGRFKAIGLRRGIDGALPGLAETVPA